MSGRTRRRGHAPGLVNTIVSIVVVVVIAAVALTATQTPPPAIAELAPSPVQQIKDAPAEQTSTAGDGEGGAGGGAGAVSTSTTTTVVLGPDGTPTTARAPIERARVRRCVGNPPRQTEDPQSPPCVPYWQGDNGGETYKGVSRDTIRLAIPSTDGRLMGALEAYFNKRYEFYGRKVHLVTVGGGNTCQERKASAVGADEQLKVFGSLAANSGNAGACYQTEMARRGLVSITSNVHFGENEMTPLGPHLWQHNMSFDKTLRAAGEMYCARLHGRNAERSPDPVLRTMPRKLGIILQNVLRDTDIDTKPFEEAVARCGAVVARTERLSTNEDVGLTSPEKAQLAMARFKNEDVTTILNLGIAFASNAIPAAADNQRYFPEWIFTTYGGFDGNLVIKTFWPQASQRQAIFGVSVAPPMRPWSMEPALTAMKEVDPDVDPTADLALLQEFTNQYRSMLVMASGIQLAGPNLTPRSFSDALQRTKFPYPAQDPTKSGDVGFSKDHSMTDDVAEFWWSEAGRAPKGWQSDGSAGAVCFLDGGARRRLGSWPTGPGRFFEGACDSNA